jgi:hypothetical protein
LIRKALTEKENDFADLEVVQFAVETIFMLITSISKRQGVLYLQVQASIGILAKQKHAQMLPMINTGNYQPELLSLVDTIIPFKDLSFTEASSSGGEKMRSLLSEGLKLAIFFNDRGITNLIVNYAMK